jgi:hypothetical protein
LENPPYLDVDECDVYDAFDEYGDPQPLLALAQDDFGQPTYIHFPDVNERFVDFGAVDDGMYDRFEWRSDPFPQLILPATTEDTTDWYLGEDVSVLGWLEVANGPEVPYENIDGFVAAASDALRTIEFIHNYAVPDNLPFE